MHVIGSYSKCTFGLGYAINCYCVQDKYNTNVAFKKESISMVILRKSISIVGGMYSYILG